MSFKARVDPSLPVLCSCLRVMIFLQVNSEFPGLDMSPILHLGTVRLPLEWLPNATSRITGRDKIRTQDLAAQSPADALPTELSQPATITQITSNYYHIETFGIQRVTEPFGLFPHSQRTLWIIVKKSIFAPNMGVQQFCLTGIIHNCHKPVDVCQKLFYNIC